MVHILANGIHNRFANDNKHLLPTWGEPVVRRTCRQLHDEDIDVMVHTCEPVTRAWVEDMATVVPGLDPLEGMLQEELAVVREYAKEAVSTILYGDVVWEFDKLMMAVQCKETQIFGNKSNHGGEGYAIVHLAEDVQYMIFCYEAAIEQVRSGKGKVKNSGWLMSRRWMGVPPEKVAYNEKMFTDIGGWTMDFDYATDYEYFKKRVEPYHDR